MAPRIGRSIAIGHDSAAVPAFVMVERAWTKLRLVSGGCRDGAEEGQENVLIRRRRVDQSSATSIISRHSHLLVYASALRPSASLIRHSLPRAGNEYVYKAATAKSADLRPGAGRP